MFHNFNPDPFILYLLLMCGKKFSVCVFFVVILGDHLSAYVTSGPFLSSLEPILAKSDERMRTSAFPCLPSNRVLGDYLTTVTPGTSTVFKPCRLFLDILLSLILI